MGAGTNTGKGAGYGNRMPGPAAFAGKYPSLSNASFAADVANQPQPATSLSSLYAGAQKPSWPMAGYGYGLEANPYNPAMAKPAMVSRPQLGAFGKPSIGYGGGMPRAQMW